jgi:hypothetical protein
LCGQGRAALSTKAFSRRDGGRHFNVPDARDGEGDRHNKGSHKKEYVIVDARLTSQLNLGLQPTAAGEMMGVAATEVGR